MANPSFYDDEFDFGGDDADDHPKPAVKRPFMGMEDDDEDGDLYPAKKMYVGTVVGNDHATTTILNLRASLEERDSTITKLQKELKECNEDLELWQTTFQIASLVPLIGNPEPHVVLKAFEKLQRSEEQLKEQLLSAKRREAAMLVKLSHKEQEIADLKQLVYDLRLLMKPKMMQARRLLLDPAIHAEFTRMKKELDASEKKVKELQDDLAAVQFTPHSKNGKMLMAKCRTLQEENDEIGREASEGKMHELSTKLDMQKHLCNELRTGYQELFEYVDDLNLEAERLQQTIYLLHRELQQKDYEIKQLQSASLKGKQIEVQGDTSMKSREEERGHYYESKRDNYREDIDSRDRPSSESKRR